MLAMLPQVSDTPEYCGKANRVWAMVALVLVAEMDAYGSVYPGRLASAMATFAGVALAPSRGALPVESATAPSARRYFGLSCPAQ